MEALLLCLVVAITDGDTLKVRCGDAGHYEQRSIRLAEIDAPEKRQPFGARSKASLSSTCFGAWAKITPQKLDRYGRTVARVNCRGQDASEEQARTGMAWAYTFYVTDQRIASLADQAKQLRIGLWADPRPVPPWEFRAAKRAGGIGKSQRQ